MAVDLYTSVIDLSPEVEQIEVKIYRGGGFAVTLEVTDENGVGVDLTGTIARLYINYGKPGQVTWTATTVGSQYRFDVSKTAVDALTFAVGEARLSVENGANSATWGIGQARVI